MNLEKGEFFNLGVIAYNIELSILKRTPGNDANMLLEWLIKALWKVKYKCYNFHGRWWKKKSKRSEK